MNWSLILIGLVALSGVAIAENSYLIIVPKLFKVGYDNQFSVFIGAAPQPVEVKYILTVGSKRVEGKVTVNSGETRNATLTLPWEFPVGAGEITMIGTGGITFEDKRDCIVYDSRHVILVQTSTSTYRPQDTMEIRVVVTNEELMPLETGEVLIEIYDSGLKLIGKFPNVPIRGGLTETIRFPIGTDCNVGTWLVSATVGGRTSSLEVLVAAPVTPSFDLKGIFQRFILRTEKYLRGVIEIDSDSNEPIFGRGFIAVGSITEQDLKEMMAEQQRKTNTKSTEKKEEPWRKWKSQPLNIAGRIEVNYDLVSLFNVDVTKAVAIQVYIQVFDLISGQDRVIEHVIPIFTRDVVYDIRPLEFETGIKNEFQVIAKRPDGKPAKMEDMVVTVTMMIGDDKGKIKEEKVTEIKDFYMRDRTDIGYFTIEIPENCIGVLMTIVPLGDDGKVRGYRTHTVPLMPTPHRGTSNGKLTIELMPSSMPMTGSKEPVTAQISTVDRTSTFYVQLLPWKSVEKFEPLPMSYVLMTNGRITGSGTFTIQPTKECQSKSTRSIQNEPTQPPTCVFNGTLSIQMTRNMMPYSTLVVYTFQPTFGYSVAESYRFSVGGLFKGSLGLSATVVPYTSTTTKPEESEDYDSFESSEEYKTPSMEISKQAQDKTRVQLSFTGTPGATVGLNVIEYDGVMQGLSGEITKERILQYLTSYEQVPIVGMPTKSETEKTRTTSKLDTRGVVSETLEQENIRREEMSYKLRYPLEKMVFGIETTMDQRPMEGDDAYQTSNMERFYGANNNRNPSSSSQHYRRKSMKAMNQYDVTVNQNDFVVATSMPLVWATSMQGSVFEPSMNGPQESQQGGDNEFGQSNDMDYSSRMHGSPSWYEKMNSKLSMISQEAFTFMQSGLSIVSDFEKLRLPSDMERVNLTKLYSRFRQQSTFLNDELFTDRDDARQVLEEYLVESDLSMMPPEIMLEEQARIGYYRSIYFNTSRIETEGTGKVVLPRTKPYSTWLATGFSLHAKSGLSVAQPVRLPTNTGLFILGNFPDTVQIGEQVLMTYGINNYLGKDLTNVMIRIRASADFDLMETTKPDRVASTSGKDYIITIPSLKSWGVETRNITLVPKRAGVVKIIIEVESEFGGDYEVMTTYVRESGIERRTMHTRLYDLTEEKKPSFPVVHKVDVSPFLRSVRFSVSGTGVDRLIQRYPMVTSNLIGIDNAIIRLWRHVGLRRYLNETKQFDSVLDDIVETNMTKSIQELQKYNDYDGSYAFISDEGLEESSFYLTTLSFGALMSPFIPVRDYVTLNRTLTWILSRQQEDGSFYDKGPCYHKQFCSGEYRREGLTALFLYTMTRDNMPNYLPEFMRRQLFNGERSPVMRAQRYLESRLDSVKPCTLTQILIELVLTQTTFTSSQLRQKIFDNVRGRQLTVVPEDGSKFMKCSNGMMSKTDLLLYNSMTLSVYANFDEYKIVSQMARWIVQQIQQHPYFDTVLQAVFTTDAWLDTTLLFRKQFGLDKFALTIDVTTDNGQKQQFKIDQRNMDITQKFVFTMPVNQITYTVSGFGICNVQIRQIYVEKQQTTTESMPFQITNEMTPLPWLNEIKTKTCATYTPTMKETFNRTVVVSLQLPTATRVNLRQLGFVLSQVQNVMHFTYHEDQHVLNFFLNVPSTYYGKPICFEWVYERLSFVSTWAPICIRVYDYLEQDTQLVRVFPIQLQPSTSGYTFIEAVQRARPTMEQIVAMQKQMPKP